MVDYQLLNVPFINPLSNVQRKHPFNRSIGGGKA